AFRPQVLVSQHGCDSHRDDPLTDLMLTVEGQRAADLMISDLADRVADGRWLALGGGGYAVRSVVPRAWTHLLAVMARHPVTHAIPVPDEVRQLLGDGAPRSMGDLPGPV